MLFRCEEHVSDWWPQGQTYTYVAAVEPLGYPEDTAAICGRDRCESPAMVFLDDRQFWRYEYENERIFRLHNRDDAAVKVTDEIVRRRSDLVRPEEYGPQADGSWPEYPDHQSAAKDW